MAPQGNNSDPILDRLNSIEAKLDAIEEVTNDIYELLGELQEVLSEVSLNNSPDFGTEN